MTEEDPDLLAGDNLDRLRGRTPYPDMSERLRLWEELENAKYQNNLLAQRCRELEQERDEARREVADAYSKKTMNGVIVKTLNGVIVDGGKATPPKYEGLENE
jgi:single-stranded DNA-specific DHH superfamily exonuclease